MEIITVFLEDGSSFELPVASETTSSDVIDCLNGSIKSIDGLTLHCVTQDNTEYVLKPHKRILDIISRLGSDVEFHIKSPGADQDTSSESSSQSGYPVYGGGNSNNHQQHRLAADHQKLSRPPVSQYHAAGAPPQREGPPDYHLTQQLVTAPRDKDKPVSTQNQQQRIYSPENMPPVSSKQPAKQQPPQQEYTAAQVHEMRERSKVLREQVINTQKSVISKEGQLQRLRNERLPSDEIKQETNKLARLQERIGVQEARLRKLRETKSKIQQQVIINNNMNSELDGLRSLLANKEKEIQELDQVINQLNTKLEQAKVSKSSANTRKSQQLARIEKLKQEMLTHKRSTEAVQEQFSTQRDKLQNKKDDMSRVDLQISELWRKLQQAKAAHQQSQQKSATVIAAVGPFEHKPAITKQADASIRSHVPSPPTKHQEIDIKLIERNGGSGQSSPSISDEREPFDLKTSKAPPPPVILSNHRASPTVLGSPRVHNDAKGFKSNLGSDQLQANSGVVRSHSGSSVSSSELPSDEVMKFGHRTEPPFQPTQPSKPSSISVPHSNSDPLLSSHMSKSQGQLPSPGKSPIKEMKIEKGPVHHFRQTMHPQLTSSNSDPSLLIKSRNNYNSKPRPFGYTPAPAVFPSSTSTAAPAAPNSQSQDSEKPPMLQGYQLDQSRSRSQSVDQSEPPVYGKPTTKMGGRSYSTSDSIRESIPHPPPIRQAYPTTHDVTRSPPRVLSPQSSSNLQHPANNSDYASNGKDSTVPANQYKGPRYASRNEISSTYIQHIDKNKLEQYKRDMEEAIKDISSNKNEAKETAVVEVVTPPSPMPEAPSLVSARSSDDSSKSMQLQVLAPTNTQVEASDLISNPATDAILSEDEKISDPVPVIYNPQNEAKEISQPIKSIIKQADKNPKKTSMDKARFHPLVILLDTALNGTQQEVQEILPQVPNPSAANDEGITALHNAICAGHLDIVQTLVEFGVDVNAVDTDGWTPLHCAASCNNQPVVEYLVNNGACIYATTYSDQETAREKCEIDEEGYDGTSRFLTEMEQKLGEDKPVYCVYDYAAQNPDELTLHINDKLDIIRRGDEEETDWWWGRCGDREGYVAKNLLSFSPRVTPRYKMSES